MKQVSDIVQKFFQEYEHSLGDAPSPEPLASLYSAAFMFAGPQGTQAVKREDFLKALPKRQGFFKTVGLTSSTIQALEETRLDDHYFLVKAYWQMRFEKGAAQPVVDESSATYLLHQQDDGLKIVLQLDHQDLLKRVQDLGLLPVQD